MKKSKKGIITNREGAKENERKVSYNFLASHHGRFHMQFNSFAMNDI
jgi:hypothetical protein